MSTPTKSLPVNFRIQIPEPFEAKFVSLDIAARNEIHPFERYKGLMTYVVTEDKFYYLSGGITDDHWKPFIPDIANWVLSLSFQQLKVLQSASGLVEGRQYMINDYVTKHLIPTTNAIHANSTVEPLILKAVSNSSFHSDVISTIQPHHKIEYRFDLDVCEDNTTPRPGMITSRYDPYTRTFVGCDYLGVVQRRYKIEDKVYANGVLTEADEITVTISGNRPTLNNRVRYEVKFDTMTHAAGAMKIILQYGNNVWNKPLVYHLDQEGGEVPANYFSGKKGTIIYNPDLDAFVFMGFIDIGSGFIGTYSSPVPTNYSIGHGITFTVNANDYEDVPIFNGSHSEVHIPTNPLNLGNEDYYPNTVFRGDVQSYHVGQYSYRVTYLEDVQHSSVGDMINNALFEGELLDFKAHNHMSSVLYLKPLATSGHIRQEFYFAEAATVCPVMNFQANVVGEATVVFNRGSNFRATAIISESNLFLDGTDIGGSVPNNFYIIAPLYRCLIGYVTTLSLNINKTFNNETLFKRSTTAPEGENLLGHSDLDTLIIRTLQEPVGGIQLMGRDEVGKVVDASHLLDSLAPPVQYVQPTVTLTTNQIATGREVGEVVNAQLTATFVRNDAGPITSIEFIKDGTVIHTVNNPSSPVAYTDPNITISTTAIVYTARINYQQGPIKNNALGNPSPNGRIPAGSKTSAPRNAVGSYIVCFGPVASVPTNSAQARAMTTALRGSGNVAILNCGTTLIIQAILIPPGSTLASVIDLDASMQDLTIQYELTSSNFTVNDASNEPVTGYKLYVRTQGTPYPINHRHEFTMG